jgi:hypothetical protein
LSQPHLHPIRRAGLQLAVPLALAAVEAVEDVLTDPVGAVGDDLQAGVAVVGERRRDGPRVGYQVEVPRVWVPEDVDVVLEPLVESGMHLGRGEPGLGHRDDGVVAQCRIQGVGQPDPIGGAGRALGDPAALRQLGRRHGHRGLTQEDDVVGAAGVLQPAGVRQRLAGTVHQAVEADGRAIAVAGGVLIPHVDPALALVPLDPVGAGSLDANQIPGDTGFEAASPDEVVDGEIGAAGNGGEIGAHRLDAGGNDRVGDLDDGCRVWIGGGRQGCQGARSDHQHGRDERTESLSCHGFLPPSP